MAALAAMVVVATLIAVLYSVQAARNNYADPGTVARKISAPSEYADVDDEFESEFAVATSTLMSDIASSVDSLVTSSDEWAYGSLFSEMQTATSNLWEDVNSF